MRCGLAVSSLLVATAAGAWLVTAAPAAATLPDVPQTPALQRFLAIGHSVLKQATAVRRLEARNDHFDTEAWMEVRTEADEHGFRYTVLGEGGSGLVRNRALRGTLEQEKRLWEAGESDRAWFTTDNYDFTDHGVDDAGLARIGITPRRKDMLLLAGAIFLNPDDGELVRIEGTMSKSPSFWTRRVDVVRQYARIIGVHVPVSVESNAQIRIAGSSTFKMTYKYETVNGVKIE